MQSMGKLFTLVFWGFVIAGGLNMLGGASKAFLYVGLAILLAHAAEVVLVFTAFKDKVKPQPADAPLVLLFGAFQWMPRFKAAERSQG